ncbi:BEACH domain-containing protein C2-like [Prosopis cineraria]|uniref:BEACH domain-containing protein C2-like n=1 Tax=Prosopis cineraria TaxID=364024 RepID=UPI00240EBC3F|nr:BEACH domain-containing protein C2-like [Prosopis cineraria]
MVAACGHADNSIKLISSDGAKTLETACAHSAPVTCLGLSLDSKYLVTGSRDTTVILWRIHRALLSRSSVSEPSSGTGTQPSTSSNSSSNLLTEKNRRCRIEGSYCPPFSDGVVVTWNESEHTLSTFTLNGVLIAETQLSFSSRISCIEIPVDGKSALIGINPLENAGVYNNSWNLSDDDIDSESGKAQESNGINASLPSICFLDLHTLKVFHILKLGKGQDITALALNKDNTNLLVSTLDKQLIIFTDPALSLKVVDQMLKLGWEGDGLTPLIKS